MTAWWLAFRYFGDWRRFFNLSTTLSILGMTIGVGSLVVSMAVFSGYSTTLEKTLQDAVGHVLVFKRGNADQYQMMEELRPVVKDLVAETPFIYAEAILAHKGKISGVQIEGMEESSVNKVLNLKSRLIAGDMNLGDALPSTAVDGEWPKALIGKGIAQKFNLKVGDEFRMVIPLATDFQNSGFQPKLGKFRVGGIVNLGRHDFDSRYVVLSIAAAQDYLEIGKRVTGYRLRLSDPHLSRVASMEIADKFKAGYYTKDWQDMNRFLLEAARLEKMVLFFVLMILVVAAAFNIANTLFISVVQRYRDISVLKTLGASNRMIKLIFTAQGLIVGTVGALSGIVFGLILCELVEWIQVTYKIIPAEIYKLDQIDLEVRFLDLVAILFCTLVVCLIATWVPSRRGAKISPVEGLRYD